MTYAFYHTMSRIAILFFFLYRHLNFHMYLVVSTIDYPSYRFFLLLSLRYYLSSFATWFLFSCFVRHETRTHTNMHIRCTLIQWEFYIQPFVIRLNALHSSLIIQILCTLSKCSRSRSRLRSLWINEKCLRFSAIHLLFV